MAEALSTVDKLISGQKLEVDVPTDGEIPKVPVPDRPTTQEQREYVSEEGFQIDSLSPSLTAVKDKESNDVPKIPPVPLVASMPPFPPTKIEPIDPATVKISRLLKDRLGHGSFGYVYRGCYNGTDVAVKELPLPQKKKTKICISQLYKNEINVSATVRHPNIMQFYGYSIEHQGYDSYLILVYELIDGKNLDDILAVSKLIMEYDFNVTKRYSVLLQVSQALAYLHGQNEKIIHGDIKPANVMLTRIGDAKLCDIGLSKIKLNYAVASLVTTAAAQGTPFYMAPEQLLSQKTSSTYSDVYAFGALMYEVLFEEYMWELDYDDYLDSLQKLKDKMEAERVPHTLMERADHPACSVILKCVQFEYDQRADSLSLVRYLRALCTGTK